MYETSDKLLTTSEKFETVEFIQGSCIIVCNRELNEAIEINNVAREYNCKMVYVLL